MDGLHLSFLVEQWKALLDQRGKAGGSVRGEAVNVVEHAIPP
ncbi:hypothetical protein KCH_00240 [Kitasatospora cheerisanensis KCTC 2395]|uniref:Uncharacterized protein n=1 Tax=Kitasatospora cheerisanensis KCTC 2395 TaxID=1348663 RepID=A0A066Z7I7_9ACTN|nr:hypothetical protein KCH_00240 [Kitasatospora cheerisanensis KCTC 2395]